MFIFGQTCSRDYEQETAALKLVTFKTAADWAGQHEIPSILFCQ